MPVPNFASFELSAPIDNVPVGATGQIRRLDSYHLALVFDTHEDLVFDVSDTDPSVWAAIAIIQKHTIDPPRHRMRMAAALAVAFIAGWLSFPQPDIANDITHEIAAYIGINSD